MKNVETKYQLLHGRITTNCRQMNAQLELKSDESAGQALVREVDSLVRPWLTAEAVHEAPKPVVADLMTETQRMEDRLARRRKRFARRVKKVALLAVVACGVGILMTLLVTWLANGGWMTVDSVTYSVARRIRQLSFLETMGIAVFISWLAGTWMLSSVYKS